jgi:hypothetical protein
VYEEKLTDLRHSKVTLLTNKSESFLDLISENFEIQSTRDSTIDKNIQHKIKISSQKYDKSTALLLPNITSKLIKNLPTNPVKDFLPTFAYLQNEHIAFSMPFHLSLYPSFRLSVCLSVCLHVSAWLSLDDFS